jgi:hypothetical protein
MIIVKVLAVLGVVFLALQFLQNISRQPTLKNSRFKKLTREQKSSLRSVLKKIRDSHLSAKDEVIATYHALLRVFEAVDFSRAEELPVDLFANSVGIKMPSIERPMVAVTSSFELALYGQAEPDSEKMKVFRDSTGKILKYFGF